MYFVFFMKIPPKTIDKFTVFGIIRITPLNKMGLVFGKLNIKIMIAYFYSYCYHYFYICLPFFNFL